MSDLQFERGSSGEPRGHALYFLRSTINPTAVLAAYVMVLPIPVDVTKYLPPMLAQSMGLGGAGTSELGGITVVPWPPVPEPVESLEYLRWLAEARGDDLVTTGSADPARMDALMQMTSEAAQAYGRLYAEALGRRGRPSASATSGGDRGEGGGDDDQPSIALSLDVDEVLLSLMGDHERLSELVKLTGTLRDAVTAGSTERTEEALGDLRRLARHSPEKYRLADFLEVAALPGDRGRRLVDLYIDRCYRVMNEDYAGLREVDERIRAETATG